MYNRKRFLPLIAFTCLVVILVAGYVVSAQKKSRSQKIRDNQTRLSTAPSRSVNPANAPLSISTKGARGQAIATSTVNLADLLSGSNSETNAGAGRVMPAPRKSVDFLPIPAGLESAPQSRQNDFLGKGSAPSGPYTSLVASPAPLTSFQALTDDQNTIPPATNGAVGPNHVMTALNTEIKIQDRNGNVLSTGPESTFWNSLRVSGDSSPIDVFDPRLLYDASQNRWVFVILTGATTSRSSILIAVSATNDPTGSWFLYRVDVDASNTFWADYPSVGINKNWIVVSTNMFGLDNQEPTTRTQTYAFNKANLYAHGNDTFAVFDKLAFDSNDPNSATALGDTLVPATTYDDNQSTMYLLNRWDSSTGRLRIYTITGAVGSETFTATPSFPQSPTPWGVNPSSSGDYLPQAGLNSLIDAGDTRVSSLEFRNGSLWASQTIFLPAVRPNRSAVQWWQIDPTNGSITQRGTIDDPTGSTYYAYPSIAVSSANDVVLGYSRFSPTQFPSANYSYRAGTDPANSLRSDTVFKNGEGPYNKYFGGARNRWGDYSSTVVDPANQLDLWTLQEYAAAPSNTSTDSGNWATWWVRVRADGSPAGPAPSATPTPTPGPTPPVPANDNFANAQAISGCSGFLKGNNVSATAETSEPANIPAPNGTVAHSSVWYKWTAPATGTFAINTNGSNFDTTLAVYTGFSASQQIASSDDDGDGLNSSISVSVNSGVTYFISVDGFYDGVPADGFASGDFALSWSLSSCSVGSQSIQFSSAAYSVGESAATAMITVYRTNGSSGTATVNYTTNDGTAKQGTDYNTSGGTLTFADGETIKTVTVLIIDDTYAESNENLTISLSSPTGAVLGTPSTATITILDNDQAGTQSNPADNVYFFVRQHYADFLAREPDQGGFDFWVGQINQCGTDPLCIHSRRVGVSDAFFFELEFQQTGAYVYRLYRAAYGNNQPFPAIDASDQTTANKIPSYTAFSTDRAKVVGGVDLATSQLIFATQFVARPEFIAKYPASLAGPGFVDALLANIKNDTNVDLTVQRPGLITLFNSGGRAAVVYRIADDNVNTNPINNRAFIDEEYNGEFVATQYYGYLRRDPDIGGYLFWLGQINRAPLRDVPKQQALVCSFITSQEYQFRFGPIAPHSNEECPR